MELVVSTIKGIPLEVELDGVLALVPKVLERGYFLPSEELALREYYRQYLCMRSILLGAVADLEPYCDDLSDWDSSIRAFAVAFTAACALTRASGYLVDVVADHSIIWKKLDEADVGGGLGKKSFTRVYKNLGSSRRQWRFYEAILFWELHADEIMHLPAAHGAYAELIELLETELPLLEKRKLSYLKRHFNYRIHAFKRGHRSSYRKVMFELFRMSGRLIADINNPVVAIQKSGKRVTPRVLRKAQSILQPGDVIITRHDEAMSNLFLPGFWPHASFYMGTQDQRDALGLMAEALPGTSTVEAKKDGVRMRQLDETLAVDAFLILRPKLQDADRARVVESAMGLAGKRYDFLFDFRQSERLACTGVIYRAYQGTLSMPFELRECAGRLCLSAEELLDQATKHGTFDVVAIYGVKGIKVHEGEAANEQLLLHKTR
ncbi:YiiX/YebB-like N1pC/P60 family cysteine hydrolase [Rubritalea marina]|uniref:YiiX/YebB-like N1pC/P60 family cysteine hydrolase n=1 Tax=Rubritalea marina TaxID=361055 RepID=UPI0003A0A583|nr:YiiX/YebB-like N1pC/P60 family cysteine hydrolase [Rubritalea marina]